MKFLKVKEFFDNNCFSDINLFLNDVNNCSLISNNYFAVIYVYY